MNRKAITRFQLDKCKKHLKTCKIKQLISILRTYGVSYTKKYKQTSSVKANKDELIKYIVEYIGNVSPMEREIIEQLSFCELQVMCKYNNIPYRRPTSEVVEIPLDKPELIKTILFLTDYAAQFSPK